MEDLEPIISELRTLETLLDAEREALVSRDLAQLAQCTEAKQTVCERLGHLLPHSGLNNLAADFNADAAKLDPRHKELFTLAERVRDSNLVNGKILARSQQFVREAITVLSGKTLDGLYGHSGQHTEQTDSGNAIAQA